jgi:hypothetical protein
MVILERHPDNMAVLYGSTNEEWIVLPYWPCSGATVRKIAPDKLPRTWIDECAIFADKAVANEQEEK